MRIVYIALFWCAGIVLAAERHSHVPIYWLLAALAFLSALFLCFRWRGLRGVLLLLIVGALGGLRFALTPATAPIAAYNGHGGVTISGMVDSDPVPRGSGQRFVLEAQAVTRAGQTQPSSGRVLVDVPFGFYPTYGAAALVTGEIFQPQTFDTFSYADFLARSGIYSHMPNASYQGTTINDDQNRLTSVLTDIRHVASQNINRALPEPYSGLLNGALLGDESGIAPAIEDAYAATGAAHVVAISGYNMVVISGILLSLLSRTRLPRTAQAWIALSIIILYTFLVGASASVVRAAIMSGLLIFGERIVRRRTFVPASLAFATLIMSLHSPYVLWDVGFQLSLFATLGIVLFTRPLTARATRQLARYMPAYRAESVAQLLEAGLFVSIAAQALTLPLVGLYFERLSLVSIPVNFLIAPAQPFVLILGGAAALLALLSVAAAQPLFLATLLPLAWTTTVVRGGASLPFAEVSLRLPPNGVAFFFFLLLGGAMLHASQPDWAVRAVEFARRRRVFVATCTAGFAVVIFLLALIASRPDGRLHIWLLDMGHGHALLLQAPSGAQMLIDGGRFPSRLLLALGDRLPFNDRALEVVAITQPDEFDYAALPEVFTRYTPQLIIMNGQANPGRAYAALRDSWGNTPTQALTAGYTLQLDRETRLEVLHPTVLLPDANRLNDNGLILRLAYRDFSLLIPGDASSRAQTRAVEGGLTIASTGLIVPQHGAAGSLDDGFLEAVSPEFALLQTDPANRLGDPNADTLAKLGTVPLYRTDTIGTIHVVTDGTTYEVRSER